MVSTDIFSLLYVATAQKVNLFDFSQTILYNTLRVNNTTGNTNMKRRTRSILEELNSLGNSRNTELLIENRGANIIESAINLMTLIKQQFNEEESAELERRFLNAIRTADARKFKRGVLKIQESRKTPPLEE
jgi:predicted amino acid-binding ACT domain protein